MGLVGYYRKFIKNLAKIAKPVTLLTRQQVKFEWTPEHQQAFLKLKDSIIQAPILHYPNPSDTSFFGITIRTLLKVKFCMCDLL